MESSKTIAELIDSLPQNEASFLKAFMSLGSEAEPSDYAATASVFNSNICVVVERICVSVDPVRGADRYWLINSNGEVMSTDVCDK
jgi:hypothetical protein